MRAYQFACKRVICLIERDSCPRQHQGTGGCHKVASVGMRAIRFSYSSRLELTALKPALDLRKAWIKPVDGVLIEEADRDCIAVGNHGRVAAETQVKNVTAGPNRSDLAARAWPTSSLAINDEAGRCSQTFADELDRPALLAEHLAAVVRLWSPCP